MFEPHIEAIARELPGAVQASDGRAALLPRSEAELSDAMRIGARVGARFVAPGGVADPDAVTIDLRRLTDVLAFDDTSHLVHVEAGLTLATLEQELSLRGQTLALDVATEEPIGAWLARGAPGARPRGDDPVDQWVAGASAVLADGRILHIRPAPRRAVGPDLVSALIGARGRLGVITSAHLVTRRRDEEIVVPFRFDTLGAAESALAWTRGRGVRPASSYVAALDGADGATVLVLRIGGERALRDARASVARRCALERGGAELEPSEAPPRPAAPPSPKTSRIVDELARALDPDRVLG